MESPSKYVHGVKNVAISMDLGGSHASIGLMCGRHLLAVEEVPLKAGTPLVPLLPRLKAIAQRLLYQQNVEVADLLGVSVSIAALVDARNNCVLRTNGKYADAVGIDLKAWAREAFDLPLRLDNDARLALLGECSAGVAQGADSVVMITLGTGIGCAVMAGGKPFRTSQPQGGCVGGHIPVKLGGRLCTCGAIGCMEAEASTWALPDILSGWPGIRTSPLAGDLNCGFKGLFHAASQGDPVAVEVRDHCILVWSVGVVGLIHAYGPDLIVVGGGVMKAPEIVLPPIQEYVNQHAWTAFGPIPIRAGVLASHAAHYGAIPLLQEGSY